MSLQLVPCHAVLLLSANYYLAAGRALIVVGFDWGLS